MKNRLLIVGASGDVGRGITEISVKKGWQVIGAGRDNNKLQQLKEQHSALETVTGDLGTKAQAEQLWADACAVYGGIDAVIISVNAPLREQRILDASADELHALFRSNVLSHFNAAKAFIPKLANNAIFIGIGGGMADFIMPKLAQQSMVQSALRQMYRGIVKELKGDAPLIKELMILSMVNGESRRAIARPDWITDVDIGQHVCAIIENPDNFPEAILTLQNRDQVGH